MTAFDDAFAPLMANEGGYVNNPADPGGETRWGVTARVARQHGYTGPMRNLPLSFARAIAKAEYWDKYQLDEIPAQIAFQVLDAAYNGGHPAQWLQRAVGVAEDGVIGPATLAAVKAADPDDVCLRFDAYRLQYLTDLSTWPTFGRGWARRIAANLLRAAQ
ncbi:MAG TPA: glycosyl hydrolase 108 family protein [Frateuria sp.]|uniref:glycoside hydrolase family 108 protein n=1 Tax=Frateuria sp. TaxID=2211372 RepID=UPI002D809FFD|nr:glycosyl hydrolase 108 family protein [Frateuria sp.]HET6805732.1 glycosyl hydrolase 108 family protein [Frateuria sp.]